MLKQLLTSGSVLVLLFASNLSASAQTPESKPQTQAPQAQQAPKPQGSQVQQQAPQGQKVSSEELRQFANVIPKLQEIDQTAQQKVTKVIEQSGMSLERFRELYQAQRSPDAKPSSQVPKKEQDSFNKASSQIQSIERETQSQQEQAIRSGGLEPNRFSQILVALRQDPALQQQVQQLIQKK